MLGAIVGDIVGSVYEWHNIYTKDFPLFREDCFFTDDTVMTCAVAEAVMNGGKQNDFIDAMKKYGAMYPNAGYGSKFLDWLTSDTREPYNSFGNGAAMRVSPCAWLMNCGFYARTGIWPENGRDGAKLSAAVTHNHPEGIKGAAATADAIFMNRFYFGGYFHDYGRPISDNPTECKKRLKDYIERAYGYDLSRRLDDIRVTYKYDITCQGTVPEAIIAFLESTDFEDAIRNAISIGGDSDTLAAITGSIAEAAYGIPDWIKEKAYSILDEPLRAVVRRWNEFIPAHDRKPFDTKIATINDYLRNEAASANDEPFAQCHSCRFRDRTYIHFIGRTDIDYEMDEDEDSWGCWHKGYCQKFGRDWVLSDKCTIMVSYLPENGEEKPDDVFYGTASCKCYEQETRNEDEIIKSVKGAYQAYRELYKEHYDNLNEAGVPLHKDKAKELLIWSKVKEMHY